MTSQLVSLFQANDENQQAPGSEKLRTFANEIARLDQSGLSENPPGYVCFCCKRIALSLRAGKLPQILVKSPCLKVHSSSVYPEYLIRKHFAIQGMAHTIDSVDTGVWSFRIIAYGRQEMLARKEDRHSTTNLWRADFGSLYPAFKHFTHLLNPFGYSDPELDDLTL